MKKKRVEETYKLTPKGILMLETNDTSLAEAILDSLELQARREDCNALLFTQDGGEFIHVEKGK